MSRDGILEAAAEVFSECGYYRASMDQIAERAKVAKGTLYYHFPSKAQLFKQLITEGFRMIRERVEGELNRSLAEEEQIRNVIRHHIDLYLEYSSLANIFFHEISNGLEEEVLRELKAERERYVQFLADLLAGAGQETEARNINSKLLAAGLVSMLDGLCGYYLDHREETTPDEIAWILYRAVCGATACC